MIEYVAYIRTLPVNDLPSLFGMHTNADITCAQAETYSCLSVLLSLQPRTVGAAAASQEEVTTQLAKNIVSSVPKPKGKEMIEEIQKMWVYLKKSLSALSKEQR